VRAGVHEYIDSEVAQEVADCTAAAVSEALSPVFEGVAKGTDMAIGLAGETSQACAKATEAADSVRAELLELKEQFVELKEMMQEVGRGAMGVPEAVELREQMAGLKEAVLEAGKAAGVAAAAARAAPTGLRSYVAAAGAAPAMTAEQASVLAREVRMRRQVLIDRADAATASSLSALTEVQLKEKANLALAVMEMKMEGAAVVGVKEAGQWRGRFRLQRRCDSEVAEGGSGDDAVCRHTRGELCL
jgi:hypothetical protein